MTDLQNPVEPINTIPQREIIFRVFQLIEKKMYFPIDPFFDWSNDDGSVWIDAPQGILYSSDVSEGIIMQYTGLKDRKKKNIYEGDIIVNNYIHFEHKGVGFEEFCSKSKVKNVSCSHLEVAYVNYNASFEGITKNKEGKQTSGMYITQPNMNHWVVIGNIYENSELL